MKYLVIFIAFLGTVHYSHQQATSCDVTDKEPTKRDDWSTITGNNECYKALAKQVKIELGASIAYLQMSAYFSSESNYRPGLAKFFLTSAAEERGHAKKIIDFYLMRGGEMKDVAIDPIESPSDYVSGSKTMVDALKKALELEKQVTKDIRNIVVTCEKVEGACDPAKPGCGEDGKWDNEDYHTIDFLTGEFLSEQHEGMRKIVELLKTRAVMSTTFGTLADVIFDQSLQE